MTGGREDTNYILNEIVEISRCIAILILIIQNLKMIRVQFSTLMRAINIYIYKRFYVKLLR